MKERERAIRREREIERESDRAIKNGTKVLTERTYFLENLFTFRYVTIFIAESHTIRYTYMFIDIGLIYIEIMFTARYSDATCEKHDTNGKYV